MHTTITTTYYYMQIAVADFMVVSKASACRIIKRVSTAIASLSTRCLSMYGKNMEIEKAADEL